MSKLFLLVLLVLLSGCATYRNNPLTPSGFDVHGTFDEDGNATGGFSGFSWALK